MREGSLVDHTGWSAPPPSNQRGLGAQRELVLVLCRRLRFVAILQLVQSLHSEEAQWMELGGTVGVATPRSALSRPRNPRKVLKSIQKSCARRAKREREKEKKKVQAPTHSSSSSFGLQVQLRCTRLLHSF